jgi:CobQ-like glutamine amidotransferase family enzyme
VGELLSEPLIEGLPTLTGYENHGAVTHVGPGVRPLGRVVRGLGNGGGDGSEGAVAGRILATYMHGPALARNPALADLLLSWVVGEMRPLDDAEVDGLRAERLQAVKRSRWRRPR